MARTPALFAALACALAAPSVLAQTPPPDDEDVEIPAQPAPAKSGAPGPAPAPSATPGTAPQAPSAKPPEPATGAAPAPKAPSTKTAETAAGPAPKAPSTKTAETAAGPAPKAPSPEPASKAPPATEKAATSWLDSLVGLGDYLLTGYVQGQYENHRDSQDQLQQGGAVLNQDRFLVRRGRLRLDAAFPYTELALEIDGNTTRGPTFGLRRAEASLVLRSGSWDGKVQRREARDTAPPYAMLTFGLTEVPFGFELTDSARNRVFMERSQASLAFFPGEPDVGLRLSGGVGFFRYALAVMNGEPLDDRSPFALRDPNSAKDFIARVGFDTSPLPALRVSGGVSVLEGTGFHAGTPATKGAQQWRDLNENSSIDPGEVTSVPGSAATPSSNFQRWAIGLDLQVRFQTPLGTSLVYAEAGVAQNMDRGLFVADPVATGIDARHLYYYAGWVQEVTRWGLVGFRAEAYNPNADFLDNRLGKLLPVSQTIHTVSPLVGVTIPGRARLVFQYDAVFDALGRDARGVPADLDNDRFTLRLQVEK